MIVYSPLRESRNDFVVRQHDSLFLDIFLDKSTDVISQIEGTQRYKYSFIHQNVYSEVPSKKHKKAVASKFKISYQNKDFKKSYVYEVILSRICLQKLNLDIGALAYVLTDIILE